MCYAVLHIGYWLRLVGENLLNQWKTVIKITVPSVTKNKIKEVQEKER
jgi:hypothetical protein